MVSGAKEIVFNVTAQERDCWLREDVLQPDLRAKIEASRSKGKWFIITLTIREAEDVLAQAAVGAPDVPEVVETLTKLNERIEQQLEKLSI